jgi:peptide-methionine (S)-S-oxide reductase
MDTIILGGGCFWCLDAVYSNVRGVLDVVCGYSGGSVENPTYEAVCSGTTGHAEVIKIEFDSKLINIKEILEIFWGIHDPTTLNRQGSDKGTQYRSIVLYSDEEQKRIVNESMLEAQRYWEEKIVTEIKQLDKFFAAEEYHQDYFLHNPEMAYCQIIINPKLAHFKKEFKKYLK